MRFFVILCAFWMVSSAHGSELCQESNCMRFSCDNSQLKNEIASLHQKVDKLIVNEALIPKHPLGTQSNPASSCSEITTRSGDGRYWLSSGTQAEPVQVTCDFDVQLPPRSPVSGWQEIANLDMSDPSQTCPPPWRGTKVGSSRRCELTTFNAGCESVFFPTGGVPFTKLCGRVVGYGSATPGAFESIYGVCAGVYCGINDPYVDGVSITYGSSGNRKHIWSLGADLPGSARCPCTKGSRLDTPDFVGEDYYCERFANGNTRLWDGGCALNNVPCCANPNLPWFCREFDKPVTTDNIEVRICRDEARSNEDVDIDLLRIFTQ